eukprot:6469874-Amphidinium_carterae.1
MEQNVNKRSLHHAYREGRDCIRRTRIISGNAKRGVGLALVNGVRPHPAYANRDGYNTRGLAATY